MKDFSGCDFARDTLDTQELLDLLHRSKRFYEDIAEAFQKEICAIESGRKRTTTPEYSAELIKKINRILCLAEKEQVMQTRQARSSILFLQTGELEKTGADVIVRYDPDLRLLLVYMPYMPSRYNNGKTIVNEVLSLKLARCTHLPSWEYWRADFYHVYPSSAPFAPKDVDNYNYKRTIDLLALALRTTDNAARFSMSAQSVFDDSVPPGSYIEISEKSSVFSDFPNSFLGLFV